MVFDNHGILGYRLLAANSLSSTASIGLSLKVVTMHWTEPKNFSEWTQRLFSARTLMLSMLLAVLFISELRFDWVEQTLGSFLVSTNATRPESGAIWEIGKQTQTAHQAIEKIVTDRQSSYREAESATSFKQIAATIQPEEWLLVPPDLFRQLYLELPPEVAHEIIPSFDLLELINNRDWERTYFEKDRDGLNIYMLDKENRVLKRLPISPDLLYTMTDSNVAFGEKLENYPIFEDRIYPGDLFFRVLKNLTPEVREGVIRRPEHILRVPGNIVRIGISDEAISGFIQMGFEIESGVQQMVILLRGHEWAVWRLHSLLENEKQE